MSSFALDVIDPCNRTGKICIPNQHVMETKGVLDFRQFPERRDGKELSLCLLFQKGRCNAGARCHQVHASPDFVLALRDRAASTKNCCASHGDVHSCGFLNLTNRSVRIIGADEEKCYNLWCFGRTAFLDTVLASTKNGEVRVPAAKVCRLHSQSRCKFGKDCKNIHLCPDATQLAPVVPASFAKHVAPPTVDISCGLSNCSNPSHEASTRDSPAERSLSVQPLSLEPKAPLQNADSGFSFFSQEWSTAVPSPKFDLSAFEATIRSLCEDITKDDRTGPLGW